MARSLLACRLCALFDIRQQSAGRVRIGAVRCKFEEPAKVNGGLGPFLFLGQNHAENLLALRKAMLRVEPDQLDRALLARIPIPQVQSEEHTSELQSLRHL